MTLENPTTVDEAICYALIAVIAYCTYRLIEVLLKCWIDSEKE